MTANSVTNLASMDKVFGKPDALGDYSFPFCPGCTYGVIFRLLGEVLDEMCLAERTILVVGNGCYSGLFVALDMVGSPHGRAPALATAIKRLRPEHIVITLQGDGDLASIGTAEIVHAAWRGERFTTLFFNNSTYGMTGGQLAPTTLLGQKTTTTPAGRDPVVHGYPMKVPEMLSVSPGVAYAGRVSVHNPTEIARTKRAIAKAITVQQMNLGLSLVEILTTCSSNWKTTPVDALRWIEQNMLPTYPLGEVKVPAEVAKKKRA